MNASDSGESSIAFPRVREHHQINELTFAVRSFSVSFATKKPLTSGNLEAVEVRSVLCIRELNVAHLRDDAAIASFGEVELNERANVRIRL